MTKLEVPMLGLGIFFLGMGAQLLVYGENRFHIPLGLAILAVGAALMFFSFEEYRNLNRLRRMARYYLGLP